MTVKDFAFIQFSKAGKKRIIAYHVNKPEILYEYFKSCYYKPSLLAKQLNIHYQSLRKLLMENDLWKYVKTKNGKGSGSNLRRIRNKNKDGYIYSENLDSYKIDGDRSRRKLKHIEVIENNLGRELNKGEIVHHLDGDKLNNDINNLHVCNKNQHGILHKQVEKLGFDLMKFGFIRFDKDLEIYELVLPVPNL